MTTRVTYRRKNTYRTKSNQVRKFRTPGGRLLVQYRNRRVKSIVCAETKQVLNGISRQLAYRVPRRKRTVTRPYGGTLSALEVKHRIKRAFLNEEMKVIKGESQKSRKAKSKGKKK